MNPSILALRNVTMTFFPYHVFDSRPDLVITLQRTLDAFLNQTMSYDATYSIIQGLIGNVKPLEQLNAILQCSSDPLPNPKENLPKLRRKTRSWQPQEDQRLLCGIYRFGIENWTAISRFVGNGRTRSQCSQRWYRGIDPSISKIPWTQEEECRLLSLVMEIGQRSWTQIAARMGNRSDVQCRYKYKHLKKVREDFKTIPMPIFGAVHKKENEKEKEKEEVVPRKPRHLFPSVESLTQGMFLSEMEERNKRKRDEDDQVTFDMRYGKGRDGKDGK
jgi:hypothetical protein